MVSELSSPVGEDGSDSLADEQRLAICRSIDEKLETITTFEEFHELCEPLDLYSSSRFVHLELDIINKCNLQCVMCYHSFESTRRVKTVRLSPDDFAHIAASVLPHAHFLSLSLGNEPLFSPHFTEILEVASEYQVPNINFFTNGLLLDDKKIEAIIKCGVTQVCISIDGASAPTYNGIRRGGDFDTLIEKVQLLVATRDALGSPTPRLRFDFVMMRRNIEEIVDLVHLADRLGVDALNFSHLISFEGLGVEEDSLSRHKALSNEWLGRALDAAEELNIEVQFQPAAFDIPEPPMPVESRSLSKRVLNRARRPDIVRRLRGRAALIRSKPAAPVASEATEVPEAPPAFVAESLPPGYCPYPFFHVAMGPQQHVLPCPYSHGERPYGRISADEPFEAIWFGRKFTALRRRILRGDPPDMCCRCPYLANRYPDFEELFASRRNAPVPVSIN